MVQISCKNNSKAEKFPIYQDGKLQLKYKIPKRNLEKVIFDACIKPKEGEGIKASFFHLVPLINILEVPGEIVRIHIYHKNFLKRGLESEL